MIDARAGNEDELLEASTDLAADPSSPASARDFVRATLVEWGCGDLVDSAVLIASELVTNAVVHARSGPKLTLRLTAGVVRIEVADDTVEQPIHRVPDPQRPGGRGLPIVDAVSASWGIDPTHDGKLVWANLQG